MTTSVEEFLSAYTPEVRSLALQARALLQGVIPAALEMVDPPSKIIAYGTSQKYADLICAISPYKTYINIIFSRGTELPDPAGLLTGTGKRARHIRIDSVEVLQQPAVKELVKTAAQLAAAGK